jgi:hypothetical protein
LLSFDSAFAVIVGFVCDIELNCGYSVVISRTSSIFTGAGTTKPSGDLPRHLANFEHVMTWVWRRTMTEVPPRNETVDCFRY